MPIIHVPHAGSMILGPVGPTHVRFSDIATHERQEINSQAWVMEMSAEGDVALCSADGKADTMLLAEDLHKKVMLKSTVIGEVFLKQAIGTMVSLQMLVGRFKEAQITLTIGASLGCVVYRCSVLMVSRPGNMKVFLGRGGHLQRPWARQNHDKHLLPVVVVFQEPLVAGFAGSRFRGSARCSDAA